MLNDLVRENVGYDERMDSFVNWNTAVKNITPAPAILDKPVMKQFEHLEFVEKKFSPGEYDFLKETFSQDPDALSKIKKAEKTIKRLSKNDQAKKETSKKPAAPRKKGTFY